jgi:nicotinamide mononucleotide adenylyltransferase
MILHSEVNQEGMLQAYLPQLKGKRVVLSVVPDIQDSASNWANIVSALQQVDSVTANRQRHIDDILADLRTFRETQ